METALRLIISKSPNAMSQAIQCLRAISVGSPMVQVRYNHTVEIALNDPAAEWTAEERALLAEHMGAPTAGDRTKTLGVRLSLEDYQAVQTAADAADQTISDYVRHKLFE